MNGKKAKALRREVYGDAALRRSLRTYNVSFQKDAAGNPVKLLSGAFNVGPRAIYQRAKRWYLGK